MSKMADIRTAIEVAEARRQELYSSIEKIRTPIANGAYYVKYDTTEYVKYLTLRLEEDLLNIVDLTKKLGMIERFLNRKYLREVSAYYRQVSVNLIAVDNLKIPNYNTFISKVSAEPFITLCNKIMNKGSTIAVPR